MALMFVALIVAFVLLHAAAIEAGTVSAFTFSMTQPDRVAQKTASAATFTFTPASHIEINDDIEIQYPSNFFAAGVTPSALMSGSSGCTPTVTTSTGFNCNGVTTKINKDTAVVFTITGLTMVFFWVLGVGFDLKVVG
jgi:hypothetical protein